jgi:hypothetical protein
MATGTVIIPVQSAKITGSYITAGARIEGGDGPWKVLFATDSTEEALYQIELPENYSSGPVLKLKYAMASATTGKVDMEAKIMAIADGEDIDTGSFDTLNNVSGGTAVPGTAGHRDTISITLTNADSMVAERTVLIHIQRDHDDGNDTAAGDLELIGIVLEYTTS